jgi:predicted RNase H-like HicB family nuclease
MESFTGVLIKSEDGKGYTAIVVEYPGVIAEGTTKEEAKKNLADNLNLVLEHKRKEIYNTYSKASIDESFPVATA